jgi:hypothetical protein
MPNDHQHVVRSSGDYSFARVLKEDFGWPRVLLTLCLFVATPILQATVIPYDAALAVTLGIVFMVLAIGGWYGTWLARKDQPWQMKHFLVVLLGGMSAAAVASLLHGAMCATQLEVFRQCAPANFRAVWIVNFGIAALITLVLFLRGGRYAKEFEVMREKARRGEKLIE